jgi:DNA-binding NarL/FixJ family response regulator
VTPDGPIATPGGAGDAADGMGSRPIRVLVVDDQALVRDATRMLIENVPGFRSVGEAASGVEALAAIEQLAPDLVLLDVRMPDMDGIETARRIRATPRAPVVVLMSSEHAEEIDSCGAAAFVPKERLKGAVLRELWEQHGA